MTSSSAQAQLAVGLHHPVVGYVTLDRRIRLVWEAITTLRPSGNLSQLKLDGLLQALPQPLLVMVVLLRQVVVLQLLSRLRSHMKLCVLLPRLFPAFFCPGEGKMEIVFSRLDKFENLGRVAATLYFQSLKPSEVWR